MVILIPAGFLLALLLRYLWAMSSGTSEGGVHAGRVSGWGGGPGESADTAKAGTGAWVAVSGPRLHGTADASGEELSEARATLV